MVLLNKKNIFWPFLMFFGVWGGIECESVNPSFSPPLGRPAVWCHFHYLLVSGGALSFCPLFPPPSFFSGYPTPFFGNIPLLFLPLFGCCWVGVSWHFRDFLALWVWYNVDMKAHSCRKTCVCVYFWVEWVGFDENGQVLGISARITHSVFALEHIVW